MVLELRQWNIYLRHLRDKFVDRWVHYCLGMLISNIRWSVGSSYLRLNKIIGNQLGMQTFIVGLYLVIWISSACI